MRNQLNYLFVVFITVWLASATHLKHTELCVEISVDIIIRLLNERSPSHCADEIARKVELLAMGDPADTSSWKTIGDKSRQYADEFTEAMNKTGENDFVKPFETWMNIVVLLSSLPCTQSTLLAHAEETYGLQYNNWMQKKSDQE